jgi:transcription initiation factor TFIIIB Brf1 subunit/transcription initiation factor TFIIB
MDCKHLDIISESDMLICSECGEEVKKTISFGKDFKTSSPGKNNSRCIQRKNEEKSIFADLSQYQLPQNIIDTANQIFKRVTKGGTYRGHHRLSLIFACVFNSYKQHKMAISIDALKEKFNNSINNKCISKGLKIVGIGLKDSGNLPAFHITPYNLVEEILLQFDANDQQIKHVKGLYKSIENKSSLLNRSRPQSVAAGIVYWYMWKNNKNISIDDFSKRVKLSTLTIMKLYNEISKLLISL